MGGVRGGGVRVAGRRVRGREDGRKRRFAILRVGDRPGLGLRGRRDDDLTAARRARHPAARVFVRQKADPQVDDLKKEAEQDGLARASQPGECDYFVKNPQAAEAIRKAAREAKEAALKR